MYAQNIGDVLDLIASDNSNPLTADGLSSAIDLQQYEGELVATLNTPGSTGNANNTLDVTIYHSDTSGGTYTATSVAFAQVGYNTASNQKISFLKGELKQFIKFNKDVSGTSPSYQLALNLLGVKKNPA